VSASARLSIRGLGKRFPLRTDGGGVRTAQVLQGVDLDVRESEFVSIIGASGSGKTTLLRIVAGLERADEGTVTIDGRVVKGPGQDRSMVFQSINLFPFPPRSQPFPAGAGRRFCGGFLSRSAIN